MWLVLKFGGSSVSTAAHWATIAEVVRARRAEGWKPLVVCAALSRVSRMLERLLQDAVHGGHEPVLSELRQRHLALADALGVDGEALLGPAFDELARLALGASLIRDASPSLHARVLATGEQLVTTLGTAYLAAQGLAVHRLDARSALEAVEKPGMRPDRRYLSAVCAHDPDPVLEAELAGVAADVVLTEGFIARNPAGETVLVGWGGSDTSAAYFAAKLRAGRLEIWTDVPGLFTADPRQVPSARLLRWLDYAEAQECAGTGAEVLHPRCLEPVRRAGIPLHLHCTQAPTLEGTVISDDAPGDGALVKAVAARTGLTLVAMDTPGMWHEVGFLADAFTVFARHGLSVDLIATSETNVTVSLDAPHAGLDENALRDALRDLNAFCSARAIGPCAAVSLVGRNLRSLLHELGPALEVLTEQTIHLVSQAASDLNFTFVVDDDHVERVVRKLHARFFDTRGTDDLFGPSWRELFTEADGRPAAEPAWWHARRTDLLALADAASPRYVYDAATLRDAVARLCRITAVDRIFYAMKANPNPDVLRIFHAAGLGFECVSPGEIAHVRALFPDLDSDRLLFTPNFAPRREYADALAAGLHVTLDNLYPLETWPDVFAGRDLIVRLDPGLGQGHHKHVRTAGAQSKFGVTPGEIDRLAALAADAGVRIVGFHAHVGSGVTDPASWAETALFLASLAERFPDVRLLNVGGGLGVPDRPGVPPLDLDALAAGLAPLKTAHPRYALWMEPGRFLVAEAGVLLARVNQVKQKGAFWYVGIETGMNSLIRPALYGAYHEIVNLTRLGAPPAITAEVVGPICETGDVLGHSRRLPVTREGDVLLIATAGAYGHAMSNRYNLREPAGETVI